MVNPSPSSNQSNAHLSMVEPNQSPPKNPWRRYFARLIDNLLMIVISLPIYLIVCIVAGAIFGLFTLLEISEIQSIVNNVPDAIYNILYLAIAGTCTVMVESLLLCTWGTTPGKRLMGLRVSTADGNILSWPQALKRSLWINGAMFGLGCIPVLGIIGSIMFMLWQRRKLLHSGYTSWDAANHTIIERI